MRTFYSMAMAVSLLAESAAGVHWAAPAGWKAGEPKPMRAATYMVAAAPGDHEDAECVVYFFGQGQGGGVQANIDRWKGQFSQANGQAANATTGKRNIHGLQVTTIEIAGTYKGMGGPMAASPSSKPGYRMLGAIIENPGGNLFVKFTGPEKTIAANRGKFEQLLDSFNKDR